MAHPLAYLLLRVLMALYRFGTSGCLFSIVASIVLTVLLNMCLQVI